MKRYIAWYLVIAMFMVGIVPRVEAAFIPSEVMELTAIDREKELQKIQTLLETKLIQQRLKDFGFTAEEIKARLSQLSDQEIHSIAKRLDDIRVGQNGLGIVIALLVIAILVVILIKLTTGKRVIISTQ
jgi:hypothetical protein